MTLWGTILKGYKSKENVMEQVMILLCYMHLVRIAAVFTVMHRGKKQNQRLLNVAYLKYQPLNQMLMTTTETY